MLEDTMKVDLHIFPRYEEVLSPLQSFSEHENVVLLLEQHNIW